MWIVCKIFGYNPFILQVLYWIVNCCKWCKLCWNRSEIKIFKIFSKYSRLLSVSFPKPAMRTGNLLDQKRIKFYKLLTLWKYYINGSPSKNPDIKTPLVAKNEKKQLPAKYSPLAAFWFQSSSKDSHYFFDILTIRNFVY